MTGMVARTAEAAQRDAADPSVSAWVGASAGTGKTTVLTQRLLRLLLSGTAPERILCLTFTKAAAAEMANRLNGELAAWAVVPEAELVARIERLEDALPDAARRDAARRLFARVLDTPGGMRIQTIHAFCQSLLARFPIEAGIAAHFAVADEAMSTELIDEALRQTLAVAGADGPLAQAVATVARHAREEAFVALLQGVLAERGRLDRLRQSAGGTDGLIARAHRALGLGEGEDPEAVLEAACRDAMFDAVALRAAARALGGGSGPEQACGAAILRWLDDDAGRIAGFDAYAKAFLTGDGEPRKRLANKRTVEAYPACEPALRAEADRLVAVRERIAAAITASATASLLRVVDAILGRYERAKAQRAMLDYSDLILRTRALLDEPGVAPWVLYKLDGGIDHILVDEAQDTSPDQWAVIAALAEEFFAGAGARAAGRTMFAVGDLKQSIYSFQGADPDAFRRMRAHFQERIEAAEQRWRTVDLTVSFRSSEAVLSAVDTVFATAAARDGLVDPDAPEVIQHDVHRQGCAGRVEVWPLTAPTAADEEPPWAPPVEQRFTISPPAQLAQRIAAMVAGWIADGEPIQPGGPPIRPVDVMILLRRRGPFARLMVRALKDAGVAVAGVDRMVMTEQLAVMDLLALVRFVLLPEDDLNLATVLKSPLVGLDEDALFALAVGRGGRSIWSTLAARRATRADFADAHAFLAERLAAADQDTPFAFLAETLGRHGGRRRLLDRLGPDAADPIDELLALALAFGRDHSPTLQGFVHWIDVQATEVKREAEKETDAVRVMTVHGAKGLEAPIVVLPDTAQVPRKSAPILWREGAEGLLLWPPRRTHEGALCQALRAAADRKRDQEYRRLLYVAMTRARDRLYLCGWRGAQAPPAGNWHALVDDALRAAQMGEEVGEAPLAMWRHDIEGEPVATAPPPDAAIAPGADPAWWNRPPPPEPEPTRPLAPSRPSAEAPATRSPVGPDDGARFRRGLLIHRLLQTLPDLAPAQRAAACRRFLSLPLHGLDPATAEAWATETLALFAEPSIAALLEAPGRAEVPIVGRVGATAISGQIDRLVVTDTAAVVLDYKTNRPPPASEGEVAPIYLRQMAAYRQAVRAIFPDRAVRCALLWTDGPRLMWLSDTVLDHAGGLP
ncbi:MAG: double-strand break repair helicase AddA [Alphaproteobacteria bacterium]